MNLTQKWHKDALNEVVFLFVPELYGTHHIVKIKALNTETYEYTSISHISIAIYEVFYSHFVEIKIHDMFPDSILKLVKSKGIETVGIFSSYRHAAVELKSHDDAVKFASALNEMSIKLQMVRKQLIAQYEAGNKKALREGYLYREYKKEMSAIEHRKQT